MINRMRYENMKYQYLELIIASINYQIIYITTTGNRYNSIPGGNDILSLAANCSRAKRISLIATPMCCSYFTSIVMVMVLSGARLFSQPRL